MGSLCPHDLGNAVVIHDLRGDIKAHLTRADAAVISELFYCNAIQGRMVGKSTVHAHVCRQELGPQQEFRLTFRVLKEYEPYARVIFTSNSIDCITLISFSVTIFFYSAMYPKKINDG